MKRCPDCGISQLLDNFSKGAAYCRLCQRARFRAWYLQNREKHKANVKAYTDANREKVRARKATENYRAADRERQRKQRILNPEFYRAYGRVAYRKNPGLFKAHARLRSARMRGANVVEKISVDELGDRDGWVCQHCYKPVDRYLSYRDATIGLPNPMYKTIDHIQPVVSGGDHSYRNTRLVHLTCNISRGAARRPAQMRLLG